MDKGKNKIIMWLRAFIPHHIRNNTVIRFFEFLRFCGRLMKRSIRNYKNHLPENEIAYTAHMHRMYPKIGASDGDIETDEENLMSGYIEDQKNYTDMRFGKSTVEYAGCEVISVYNALYSLSLIAKKSNDAVLDFPKLIHEFEKDGMVFSGRFGTSPLALRDYLLKNGYPVKISIKENEFDKIADESDTVIMTIYNDADNIMEQIHTINISKQDGLYYAHNTYGNGAVIGPHPTVTSLLKYIGRGNAKGIVIIGICRKDN